MRSAFWMAVCMGNVQLLIPSVVLYLWSSGPLDVFQGVRRLGWRKKIRLIFSLTSNCSLAFHSTMNVGNKVI